ncbi:aminotransferase class V-fold PLP-dependent enzyme [Paenibacillus chitinolyticus]|uniref:aminotransferase class V-fold PLP-dependent enzyme n=1 Tax=Paenibacillus chitinolyticus TaxID=79263 RepID=UPI00386E18A1
MTKPFLYFDNAASSWPKPPQVGEAVLRCINEYAANPGRGSHAMAVQASRGVFEARKHAAKLFGFKNPNDLAFGSSTTEAINLAIKGHVKEGEHVICTAVEHNSVRRPLEYLRRTKNVQVTYLETDEFGRINIDALKENIQSHTSLVVINHSSNLLGSILPVADIGQLCREKGICLLVDAAQTAGILPIHVEQMGIDMLAFPGHKGLLGPQGTGGLYIHPRLDLEPLMHGGTGSQSEAIDQPSVRPDRYEAGTPNTPGLAGLSEGLKFVLRTGVENIHAKEWEQTQRIMEALRDVPHLRLLGPGIGEERTGIVSFVLEHMDASEVAFILDQHYGIAVRAGYHCTPLAHETAGTGKTGAVRASVSYFTTDEEADTLIEAVKEIADTVIL